MPQTKKFGEWPPTTRRSWPDEYADGRFGERRRVPAAKAERPLSVQSRDLRGDAGQRARRADSGHSRGCDPIDEFGRLRSFGDAILMVLVENNVVARAIHGMIV